MVRSPVLKCECEKNGTYLIFDSRYYFIVFIILFETNNTSINRIGNIHNEYIKQCYFLAIKHFCREIFHGISSAKLRKNQWMAHCKGICRVIFAPCLTRVFYYPPQPMDLTLEAGCQPDMMSESVIHPCEVFMNVVMIFFSCKWRIYVRCNSEEVYDERFSGFCVWVCVYVSLYVLSYEDVYGYYGHDAVFL